MHDAAEHRCDYNNEQTTGDECATHEKPWAHMDERSDYQFWSSASVFSPVALVLQHGIGAILIIINIPFGFIRDFGMTFLFPARLHAADGICPTRSERGMPK